MTNDTKSHRTRNALLIAGAFLLVLCGIGGGTAYYLYDRATEIDRSTPERVVVQFLDATYEKQDAAQTSLFVCDSWSADLALQAVGPQLSGVVVAWEDFKTVTTGSTASLALNAVFRAPVGGVYQQYIEVWTLLLEDQDGWRVCDLTKAPSLNP